MSKHAHDVADCVSYTLVSVSSSDSEHVSKAPRMETDLNASKTAKSTNSSPGVLQLRGWVEDLQIKFCKNDAGKRTHGTCFGCEKSCFISRNKTSNLVAHIRTCVSAQAIIDEKYVAKTLLTKDVHMLRPITKNVHLLNEGSMTQKQLCFQQTTTILSTSPTKQTLTATKKAMTELLCELAETLPLPFSTVVSFPVVRFL